MARTTGIHLETGTSYRAKNGRIVGPMVYEEVYEGYGYFYPRNLPTLVYTSRGEEYDVGTPWTHQRNDASQWDIVEELGTEDSYTATHKLAMAA